MKKLDIQFRVVADSFLRIVVISIVLSTFFLNTTYTVHARLEPEKTTLEEFQEDCRYINDIDENNTYRGIRQATALEYDACLGYVKQLESYKSLFLGLVCLVILLVSLIFFKVIIEFSKKSYFKLTWIIIFCFPALYILSYILAINHFRPLKLIAGTTVLFFIVNFYVLFIFTVYKLIGNAAQNKFVRNVLLSLLFIIAGYIFVYMSNVLLYPFDFGI